MKSAHERLIRLGVAIQTAALEDATDAVSHKQTADDLKVMVHELKRLIIVFGGSPD